MSTVMAAAVVALAASICAAAGRLLDFDYFADAAIGLSAISGAALLVVMMKNRRKDTKRGESDEAKVIKKITAVCDEICKGNFEARIGDVTEGGALDDVQHRVNDMIDRCDAFVREATASLEAVCRNVYYRRILYGGLQGSFRVAAEIINNSGEAQKKAVEKARVDAAAEQKQLVDALAAGLKNLAEGDLTYRLAAFPEAYQQIREDFNGAMTQLQETIAAILTVTREVTNATAEISSSTTDLSQRTEEQAACLEQTSASMEQIASTVKLNAEHARHANQSAGKMRDVAGRGGEVVGKAVDAMAVIETSSRKISDIIGVIDEIARQTNLLALNAAVEAARAGESGRGFAVVATEVRSLAQRSSQAAKDIKDLISSSNEQVKEGVNLVNDAGIALHEVVESIKSVADVIADIANASAEQSTGIEQINIALNQMDEVTQQNSALVEENAATAKTLEQQAGDMDQRIAIFKIGAAESPREIKVPPPHMSRERAVAARK
jgi:methyl-accepting chemotaxis protein